MRIVIFANLKTMGYLNVLILSYLFINTLNAQIYEVGVFAGGSNFIGDVGSTTYVNPNEPAFGLVFKWNRSPRHSFRFTAITSQLVGQDSKSNDPSRNIRDYSFENSIIELSAGMEFTFLEFDQHDQGLLITPYLYGGVSALRHGDYYFDPLGNFISEDTKSWSIAIPMALGIKYRVATHLILSAEIGARATFTDGIDGSVPNSEQFQRFRFGNINSTDWYVFSGVSLTYSFGRRPCYCNF